MVEENISQEFRLKNIDETRNYFLEEIKQSKSISKKHKSLLLDIFQFLLLLLCLVFL